MYNIEDMTKSDANIAISTIILNDVEFSNNEIAPIIHIIAIRTGSMYFITFVHMNPTLRLDFSFKTGINFSTP